MRCFENIDAIRNTTVEELKELPSMNENLHRKYINFFTRIIKYGIIIKEIFNACEVEEYGE